MKANRKTIAIIIATLVLVAAATTGVVMYLNDDGTSRAGFDENEPSISDVNTNPGSTEENNQGENAGNTENPVNNNEPGNLPEAGENANQGTTANRGGTTGANTNQGTTTTTGNANVPNQEYVTERVEEVERQITEDLLVGWTPLSITSAYSTNGIGIYKPDLEIVKVASTTDGNNSVAVGDALTYAMAVKNNGNEDITGLTISDVIPEQTTFIEGTIYGNGTYNKELNKIVWKVDVKAGEVVAVGFAVTLNENATGTIKNVGTIDGKNTEEVVNPVITSEKLAEVYRDKQPIEGPANIGDQIKYTIVAKNTGDVDATVVMKDTIPANTELVSPIEVAGEEIDEATMNVGKNVTVPAGETVELTFTVEIKAIKGSIKNIATVGTTIPDTETKTANLEMTKTVSDKIKGEYSKNVTLKVGETAYFKIELKNTGSEELEVTMTDIMNGADIQLYDGDKAIAQTVTVPAGTTKTLTATYKMQQEDIDNQQKLKNTATATTPVTPGNEDTAEVTPEKAEPGIGVEKTTVSVTSNGITTKVVNGEAPMVRAGDVITYTITVTNTGNTTLKDIEVIDTTLDVNYDNTTIKAGTPIDTISSLAPKDHKTYTVTYTVTADDIENKTEIENTATATGSKEVPSTPVPVNPNVTVSGKKSWKDYNNQENTRKAITVKLAKINEDGSKTELTEYDAKTVEEPNWTYEFTNLPKYDENNNAIKYAVIEEAVEGYTPSYAEVKGIGTANITANIENTLDTTPTVTVSGTKSWKDYNNQENTRKAITVKLAKINEDGSKTELTGYDAKIVNGPEWTYEFTDLPKYDENNNVIKYAVIEEAIEGYTTSYAEVKGIGTANITADIENALDTTPTVTVSGTKSWKDYDNQENTRKTITVKLAKINEDGSKTELTGYDAKTVNGPEWKYEFTNLPKYVDKDAKEPIKYAVIEEAIEGYTTSYAEVKGIGTANITADIENTLDTTPTVTVSGTKSWKDYDNQENTRKTITVKLAKINEDGSKTELTGYDAKTVNGPEWKYEFTNLPKYADKDAKEPIKYAVIEEAIEGYTTSYAEVKGIGTANITADIENTLDTTPTVTVSGTKSWKDYDNQENTRKTITVKLAKINEDGSKTELTGYDAKTVNGPEWKYEFTNLPKYADKDAKEPIKYAVIEEAIEGYTTSYAEEKGIGTANITADIENTLDTTPTVTVSGTKSWKDYNDQENTRKAITVKLAKINEDGSKTELTGYDAKIVNGPEWTYEFTDLPKYDENNNVIKYAVIEEAIEGYTTSYAEVKGIGTANITADIENALDTTPTVTVSGTKSWKDYDNQENTRKTITVKLAKINEDGSKTELTGYDTKTVNGPEWKYEFTNLPKYADKDAKEPIKYAVIEEAIEGYTTSYAEVKGIGTANITADIENTLDTTPTVTVSGTKSWKDYDNQENTRKTITVKLAKINEDGSKTELTGYDAKTVNGPEWKYEFTNLPKYADKDAKEPIKYAVIEEAIEGYTTSYAEVKGIGTANITADIENALDTTPTVTVSGTKSWKDYDNQENTRKTITVKLAKINEDGSKTELTGYDAKTVNGPEWKYEFTNLPKYADKDAKEPIKYAVIEEAIEGYTTSYAEVKGIGTANITADIENALDTTPTVTVSGTKSWKDYDNQENTRKTITVKLAKINEDGSKTELTGYDAKTVNGPEWKYEFTNLPKYADKDAKEPIKYAVIEEAIEGYTTSYAEVKGIGTANITADIENTLDTTPTVTVSGTKIWEGENGNVSLRPKSITVKLAKINEDGSKTELTGYDAQTVEGPNWTYEFTNLPKYADKDATEPIKYAVIEETVARYETKYVSDKANGYNINIINTLKPLDLTTEKITSTTDSTKGGKVAPGEEITYTISIKNNSNEATGTFNVKDSVPAGTTLKTEEKPAYTLSVENNVTWLTWNVSLEANASTTVSFTVIVDMTLNDGDKIKNKAIVDEKDTNEVIDTVKNIVRTVNVKEHGNSISKTNIVIVLDLSSSMTENNSNRLANAKTAAKEFIDSIYTSKAVSGVNIEVITFNTRDAIEEKKVESEECNRSKNPDHYDRGFFGYYEHKDSGTSCEKHGNRWYTKYVEKTETVPYSGTKVLEIEGITGNVAKDYDDAQKIKSAIGAIEIPDDYKEGGFGTHMYAALQLANTEIGKLKDAYKNNDNAVVFLGDGKPFRSKDYPEYADNTDANIKSEASKIRGKATLYAIRYAEDVALLKDINNGGIASEGCSFASTNLDELKNNFQAIKNKAQDREIKINSDNGYLTTINPTGLIVSDKKPVRIRKNGTVIATYTSLEDLNNSGLITYDATTKEIKWNVRGYAKTDKLEIEYYVN